MEEGLKGTMVRAVLQTQSLSNHTRLALEGRKCESGVRLHRFRGEEAIPIAHQFINRSAVGRTRSGCDEDHVCGQTESMPRAVWLRVEADWGGCMHTPLGPGKISSKIRRVRAVNKRLLC